MPPAQDRDRAAQDWAERLRQAWVKEPPKLDGRVRLAEYDPGWPEQYERQARAIRAALGRQVLLLEHIGSTSVPGLAAKPVIDILLVVDDPADEQAYVPPLGQAGYRLVIREPDWYRELYERTKRRLADRDWTYLQQYADAKGEVIEAIMGRAEAAGAGPADSA